jgi:tripartite-type tricarboxylate transporter receptor subunit TctC
MLSRLLPLVLAFASSAALAQAWPGKPVRFILPNSAGSGPDGLARFVAQRFEASMGQPFIIENRPGANFLIAAEAIRSAAPDGYTIGLGSATLASITPHLYKSLPYDPDRDFEYIGVLTDTIWGFFGVHPSVPARTMAEFIELAKKSPGKYTVAASVPSNGMWTLWVMKRLGVQVTVVDYKSAAQAISDVVAGHVNAVSNSFSGYEAFLKDGRVRALAAVTDVRPPDRPDLPPITDFAPGTAYDSWLGIVSPKGVPEAMVQRVNRAMDVLVREPEFAKRALAAGWSNRGGARNPKIIAELNRAYRDKWGEIVREAGVKPQ